MDAYEAVSEVLDRYSQFQRKVDLEKVLSEFESDLEKNTDE